MLFSYIYIYIYIFFFFFVAVATLFIYFVIFNTCIPNRIHTMIPYIHPFPFAEASLHFLIALVLSGDKPPFGAEPRIELGPALQQADALPIEPRRTIKPRRTIRATPHHVYLVLFNDIFKALNLFLNKYVAKFQLSGNGIWLLSRHRGSTQSSDMAYLAFVINITSCKDKCSCS
jgi:hypothetical protein